MIALSSRQKRIINLLSRQRNYVTAKWIADRLDLSEKTIYRELQAVEERLERERIGLKKQPGKGYMLELPVMPRNKGYQFEDPPEPSDQSTGARRIQILSELLSQAPKETSISRLAAAYYISNASIVNDLKFIEGMLEPFRLQLVRNQKGTHIRGAEEDIRKALMYLVNELILTYPKESGCAEQNRIDRQTYRELERQFEPGAVRFVQELLEKTEHDLSYPIGDPYYINMLSHLLILIKRFEKGKLLTGKPDARQDSSLDENAFKIAASIIKHVEQYVGGSLPEEETYFIYQHLISSGAGISAFSPSATELIVRENPDIPRIAARLVACFSTLIQTGLTGDEQLRSGLIVHFKPMMNRLKYRISIKNPMLAEIKREFPAVFDITVMSMALMSAEWQGREVSEDELGYLTLYFQNSIEQQVKCKKVLLVCSSGIGTSHLLKTRILRTFPDWKIVDTVSSAKAAASWKDKADLIISTVKLSETDVPVILVSALFGEADVKLVTVRIVQEAIKGRQAGPGRSFLADVLDDADLFIAGQPRDQAVQYLWKRFKIRLNGPAGLQDLNCLTLSSGDRLYLVPSGRIKQPRIGLVITTGGEGEIAALDWMIACPGEKELIWVFRQLYDWYHAQGFANRQGIIISSAQKRRVRGQLNLNKEGHHGYRPNSQ
ncbi:BglG family transcription antiterminator [Paenibacillus sp. TH7-28]